MSFFDITIDKLKENPLTALDFLGSFLKESDISASLRNTSSEKMLNQYLEQLYIHKPKVNFIDNNKILKPLYSAKAEDKISSGYIPTRKSMSILGKEEHIQNIPDWNQEELKLEIEEP